jgi:death-on-curing protein
MCSISYSIWYNASVGEQERMVLAIAAGELGRETFVEWLQWNTNAS